MWHRIRRAIAVLLALALLAVIFFKIGYDTGYKTASSPMAPWPDIECYDSATLMDIIDGTLEEMSELQDRLEKVTELTLIRMAQEKGIVIGG